MTRSSDLERENRALRERLSRLSEASLRINESLQFDTVLQEVLDNAHQLLALAKRPPAVLTGHRPRSAAPAGRRGRVPPCGLPHPCCGQSLPPTSGVATGRPSGNRSRKGWFTKSGAPRM